MHDSSNGGKRALEMMESALALLDEHRLPGDIGAHLDLAVHRLREHLGMPLDLTGLNDDFDALDDDSGASDIAL